MFKCLSPGAIGIRIDLEGAIRLAKETGFEGVEININEVARLCRERGVEAVRSMFEESGVKPGGWGLPVDWRAEEGKFRADLERLPELARIGKEIGCTRTMTWVLSFSDERPFDENFKWHVNRFKPIAEILKEHGCMLGLEFLGPKTLRQGHKYEFIHTMEGMLELCDAIGTGNVGLLLDSWHWYTSGGTVEDILKLKPEQVVYVHINDAPEGVPVEEQIDNIRRMPGETGVIDLIGFLRALKEIGYDGPVTPEPFSDKVKGLKPEEAASLTMSYLDKVWREAGV
ncbi:sugar phosphate isomerase/epimerase [Candidatus Poribacteria bacterium]|nr:MAG: sugar phosphate isomerase/epimerase [Candidatus Poribacteria bacterium]